MAKSNLEEDIFKVLKQRGIELNTHVENIFRFTGYNNARTLANFNCATGVQEVEKCVRSTLGKKGAPCQDGQPEENGDFRRVVRQ